MRTFVRRPVGTDTLQTSFAMSMERVKDGISLTPDFSRDPELLTWTLKRHEEN